MPIQGRWGSALHHRSREAGAWGEACGLPEPYSGGSQPPRQRQGQPMASAADRRVGEASAAVHPAHARQSPRHHSRSGACERRGLSGCLPGVSRLSMRPGRAVLDPSCRIPQRGRGSSLLGPPSGEQRSIPSGQPGPGCNPPAFSMAEALGSQQQAQYPAGCLPRSRLSRLRRTHHLLRNRSDAAVFAQRQCPTPTRTPGSAP